MNKIILICATIFVFVIGVGCASAADLNMAGNDAPALNDDVSDIDSSISVVKGHDFSNSNLRPDVQKVYISEHYPEDKEKERQIRTFWDHKSPFDYLKNMTDCGE